MYFKYLLCYASSCGICIYYRYEFTASLVSKYEHLSSLLPHKFAKLLSVSDDNLDMSSVTWPTPPS